MGISGGEKGDGDGEAGVSAAVGEGCGAGEDVYVDLGGEVGRREEKDNAEAQRTQRSAEKRNVKIEAKG